MALFNGHWLSTRAQGVRKLGACFLAVLGSISCGKSAVLEAAPITFRFDAEVVNVSPGAPFDLPLTYQVGDIIHGRFTFEPSADSPSGDRTVIALQPSSLQFEINGKSVSSEMYAISVSNDATINDSGFEAPVDILRLGCAEPTCVPNFNFLGSGEAFRVRSRLQLVGDGSILPIAEISGDPAIWNEFLLQRTINLNFDNAGLGAMGFQAAIKAFVVVPEPTSFCLVSSVLALASARFSARSLSRRDRMCQSDMKWKHYFVHAVK